MIRAFNSAGSFVGWCSRESYFVPATMRPTLVRSKVVSFRALLSKEALVGRCYFFLSCIFRRIPDMCIYQCQIFERYISFCCLTVALRSSVYVEDDSVEQKVPAVHPRRKGVSVVSDRVRICACAPCGHVWCHRFLFVRIWKLILQWRTPWCGVAIQNIVNLGGSCFRLCYHYEIRFSRICACLNE